MAKKHMHTQDLATLAELAGVDARQFLNGIQEIFRSQGRKELLYVSCMGYAIPMPEEFAEEESEEAGFILYYDREEAAQALAKIGARSLDELRVFPMQVPVYLVFKAGRLVGHNPFLNLIESIRLLSDVVDLEKGVALAWRDELRRIADRVEKKEEIEGWTFGELPIDINEGQRDNLIKTYLTLYSFISEGVARGDMAW